jgi:hypothetical protein
MTAAWAAAAMLFALPATAMRPATPDELRDIRSLFVKADVILAEAAEPEEELSVESRRIEKDAARIVRLEARLKAIHQRRAALMEDAMVRTLVAFELVPTAGGRPVMPSARSVVPGFEGPERVWTLRFGIERLQEPILSNTGPVPHPPVDSADRGRTSADGVTTIWRRYKDPRILAMLLHHELRHFQQFTTRGIGDVNSRAENEIDAYSADFRAMGPLAFAKDPPFEEFMGKFLRGQIAKWTDERDKERTAGKKVSIIIRNASSSVGPDSPL